MNRREFLSQSMLGLTGAASGILISPFFDTRVRCEKFTEKNKPNIVIFISDDTGWNDVGYHNPEIKTPNIDRLAKEGVEFDHFYVHPVCSPTRAALLTGRQPSRFGIFSAIAGKSDLALPKDTFTIADMLRGQGYVTSICGKWHLGLKPEVGPRQYGFDYSYGYLHGQLDQFTHIYKNGDRTWHRNDKFIDEVGHATDLITNEAIDFIKNKRNKTKPFFLYVAFSVPHYPLQEDDKWVNLYRNNVKNWSRQLFSASMTHMDDGIGRILSTIKEGKLDKDTLIIYLSDNGGQENWKPKDEYNVRHGPNDVLGDNKPLKGWKGDLYEGGIRVPAVMYWNGKIKQQKIKEAISVCDILPTFAYLTGAKISDNLNLDGANFWSIVEGSSSKKERVLYWNTGSQIAVRKGDWKLIHNGKTLDKGIDELYNIIEDPFETKNLAKENESKLLELRKEMASQLSLD
jgi:arylsulfatase A-like enzyme